MPEQQPVLVSKKQAAEMLNLSLRTITNFIACNELRPRKIGRRTLLSYREVLRFARRDHRTPDFKSRAANDDTHA